MKLRAPRLVVTAAVGAALVGGGGAALATTGGHAKAAAKRATSPDPGAFLADVAKRLNVPVATLTSALKSAAVDQVARPSPQGA